MTDTHATTDTAARTGLDRIARPDGTFAIIAMDQRNTLRRMFSAVGRTPDDADMTDLKADIARALSPSASGMLVDPDLGAPAVRRPGVMAPGCGVLVAAEPADKDSWNGEPRAGRNPELNAAWVREQGGDALKFLVQLRAGRPHHEGDPDLSAEVVEVVRQIVEDCREQGVPSVIENLIYAVPGEEPLTPEQRSDVIIESARMLDTVGCDLLKLEYPGSPEACRRVGEVVTGPWAVLSAGVAFDDFLDVLRISCDEGGASGFIAGRAFWKDAVDLEGPARYEFLSTEGRRRLEECVDAIDGRARPWASVRGTS
jgi:tagatose-1,6-bisphosphate aldolase